MAPEEGGMVEAGQVLQRLLGLHGTLHGVPDDEDVRAPDQQVGLRMLWMEQPARFHHATAARGVEPASSS